MGRSVTRHKQLSDVTAHVIDEEVRQLIDGCYKEAKKILEKNLKTLHAMADALIKYEKLDETQIKDIMEGREPGPPEGWEDSDPGGEPENTEEGSKKETVTPLGGPAGQH